MGQHSRGHSLLGVRVWSAQQETSTIDADSTQARCYVTAGLPEVPRCPSLGNLLPVVGVWLLSNPCCIQCVAIRANHWCRKGAPSVFHCTLAHKLAMIRSILGHCTIPSTRPQANSTGISIDIIATKCLRGRKNS